MDKRFDDVARLLGAGASRRRLLHAVGAGFVPGLLGRAGPARSAAQDAGAQGPATCARDSDCVDPDADPCTGATCVDGTCASTHGDPCFPCGDDTKCTRFRDAFGVDGVGCGGLCVGACGTGQTLGTSCECADTTPDAGSTLDKGDSATSGGMTSGPVQLPRMGSGPARDAGGAGAALSANRLRRAGVWR